MFAAEHRVYIHSWGTVTYFMYAGISPRCETLFQEVPGQCARVSLPKILCNSGAEAAHPQRAHVYKEESPWGVHGKAISLSRSIEKGARMETHPLHTPRDTALQAGIAPLQS